MGGQEKRRVFPLFLFCLSTFCSGRMIPSAKRGGGESKLPLLRPFLPTRFLCLLYFFILRSGYLSFRLVFWDEGGVNKHFLPFPLLSLLDVLPPYRLFFEFVCSPPPISLLYALPSFRRSSSFTRFPSGRKVARISTPFLLLLHSFFWRSSLLTSPIRRLPSICLGIFADLPALLSPTLCQTSRTPEEEGGRGSFFSSFRCISWTGIRGTDDKREVGRG